VWTQAETPAFIELSISGLSPVMQVEVIGMRSHIRHLVYFIELSRARRDTIGPKISQNEAFHQLVPSIKPHETADRTDGHI